MPSQVFFMDLRASAKETNFQKFQKLLDAVQVKSVIHRKKKRPLIAVKLHFGERGNTSYIRPIYVRQVVEEIWGGGGRPFLTDSNTLYVGTRSQAASHLTTAIENGFAYAVVRAPLVIADGLTGKAEAEVAINQKHFKSVFLGEALAEAEGLVVLSHFKCHELSGFGGALKNLGMGGASRKGKLAQHSNISPKITRKKCTGCGECVAHCAQEAIRLDLEAKKAKIDPKKCVGCAECILVCPYGNIEIQWNESIPVFLEKMMEYAYGALKDKGDRAVFLNFITQVSPACDCYGHNDAPIVGDLGILASLNPVALDQASADMVIQSPGLPGSSLKDLKPGSDKFKDIYPQVDWPLQLAYAEKLGLGTRKYKLVQV
ncbi:MAG: 4Fe-4S ferredoxin [Deltaproteobacteria bacterium RBG_13_58_19]|nr:MAG: 4Fe-4S ferredoxin [Deltaproteobacteria bacterium RBG_13_58_19]